MTLWLLFGLPLIGGLILLAGSVDRRWLGTAAAAICTATFTAAVLVPRDIHAAAIDWGGPMRLTAMLTPISALVAMLVPVVAGIVVAYASAHEDGRGLGRLIGLLVLFMAGMELLLIADDFLTLLIGWEAVGACSWALIGHEWREDEAGRSAIYAFIATRLGDLGLFVAAVVVFAGSASFAFTGLSQLPAGMLALATAGVVVSATAKSGQVPFAPWLFRAMAGPTSVSALLHAATMVAAGAYLLLRLQPMLASVSWFGPAVIGFGLVTALSGGVVALVQPHAKKLLAASTSAHYGLMFVATGAGFPLVAVLHLVAHALFKSLLFLAAGIAGERAGDYQLRHMGFARVMPVVAASSVVGALALGGVPPLGGAWTKEQIVGAAASHGAGVGLLVMIAGALSAAYATRFQVMAFGARQRDDERGYLPTRVERLAPALLAVASLALGVLWLKGVNEPLADDLGGVLPAGQGWAMILSLGLVAVGIGVGLIVSRHTGLGTTGVPASVAGWFRLPHVIDAGLVRPIIALSSIAARVDDRIVDAGVAATVRMGRTLSRVGSGAGEAVTDALPSYTARLVATGGRQSVRLQTGMAHHYYVMIVGGIVGVVALLLLGL